MRSFNPFEFGGRIGRLQYFGFGVIWGVIFSVLAALAAAGSGPSGRPAAGTYGLFLVAFLVYVVATLSYGVRRLHDFDKSGWWYLLGFVPMVNFVFALVLLLAPGTSGPNAYGERGRSGAGVARS